MQTVASLINLEAIFSGDLFDREIAVDERLNAMVERAIKRLIQTKAMKQMLKDVHELQQNDQRKLPLRKESNGAMKSSSSHR
jgi:hypothetical protein